ncbi:uncharacterized protein MONOS_6730 [Monocercomonoides exilis]|uniref:uncharacterized protein n=1 Tax=Monocercomonoides exilis TaxID=2049356 RepID=UPI00355A8926|nr:hypothetical protein MONOS_6730 [Monocercomonoides exilis]|eukprot:MONOS_6730.1-p1 / transcript=MONOS_6730.1 / gene=MONOS_6730 / organism=Monocercomonoides_exilis_PA203 / gene_product=unspecified product / transcript_product=unspecified product / location=Mono_scaffold00217:49184-50464(-) / protein_length=427 / sequence_SO=supercontig / SO=protein_coding / is_pseudo=false
MQLERVREMCNELDTNDDATSSFTSSSMSQGNTSSFNGRDMQHTSLMKPDSSMFSSVFIGLFQPVPIFCIPNRLRSYIPHLIADAPSLAGAAYSPLTSIPMQPDRFAPSTVISAASSTDQYRCPTSNQSSSQNDQLYQLFPPSEIESMQNAAMADLSHVSSSELTLLALLPPSSLPQHIKDILGLSSSPYLSSDSFYQPSDAQQSTMDSSFASSSSSSSPSSSSSSISSSSSSPSSSSAHPTSLADAYDDPFRSENSPLIDSDGMLQGFQGIPSAASAAIGGGGGGGGGGEGPLLRQASFPEMQWGDEEQICFDVDHHRMYCVVNEMNMKLSLRSILNALQLSLDSFTHSLRSRIEQPLQFPSYSSSDASTIPLILQSSSTAASTPSPLPPNPSRKEPLPMSYNETYFQNDELPSESEARQGESPS